MFNIIVSLFRGVFMGYQWKRFNSGRTLSHLDFDFIVHYCCEY
ncbi:hypothetical protein [Bartonella tribocorum]|nr:hypothetical protein [Bartonella tribocorum]